VKFAVTSQDFLTITGHAGKTTRFLIFEAELGHEPVETGRLDLADDQTIHSFTGGKHPLDEVKVLIAGSAGQCFVDRMQARGVITVTAPGIEPRAAVAAYLAGLLHPTSEADACSCHGE
jgi:predicted Fe-Mo cluster-binding NifX family protein